MDEQAPSARELFQRHHLPVYRFLLKSTGRTDLAEDLTQEVFVRITRALASYRTTGREQAWVFTVARNVLRGHRRLSSRRPTTPLEDAGPLPATAGSTPALDLRSALARLEPDDRDAFLLRELGGLGYEEIGAVCDLSLGAVRSRIYRARIALRQALSETPRGVVRKRWKESTS